MSRLRVFDAHDAPSHGFRLVDDEQPVILSFRVHARRGSTSVSDDSVQRAKVLRENDRCPFCRHALVEPLELADAAIGRNNRPIPGTATLVGFHCRGCHREWAPSSGSGSFC